MSSASPIAIALGIVFLVTVVGLIVAHLRSSATMSGYEEYARDVKDVAKTIRGEIFRDGVDLVVNGNYRKLPAVVRLSVAENTPGLNVRMQAPATFNMSVVPKGAQATEGRVLVRTGDDMFDARFTSRSDHPTQAKMLLGSKQVMNGLRKLACSQKTFFTISSGAMELSELVIPSPYTSHHILDHLESMRRIASELEEMPGTAGMKIQEIKGEGSMVVRVAIAVGIVAAIITVVAATRALSSSAESGPVDAVTAITPEGVFPVDAVLIPRVDQWRTAQPEDFDPAAQAWLRGTGVPQQARITGDFSGKGNVRDVAYVLTQTGGARRVVWLVEGANRYDAEYPGLGLVARFPRGNLPSVRWIGTPPPAPDGDGLLIVRKGDDPKSVVLLFLSGGKVVSGAPNGFQNLSLE